MRNKQGFTLIEMIVSIGLLAMLGLFMVTSYTAISQMNAEVFKAREYLQESMENFQGQQTGLVELTETEIQFNLTTKAIQCSVLQDPNNGLIALGVCR